MWLFLSAQSHLWLRLSQSNMRLRVAQIWRELYWLSIANQFSSWRMLAYTDEIWDLGNARFVEVVWDFALINRVLKTRKRRDNLNYQWVTHTICSPSSYWRYIRAFRRTGKAYARQRSRLTTVCLKLICVDKLTNAWMKLNEISATKEIRRSGFVIWVISSFPKAKGYGPAISG